MTDATRFQFNNPSVPKAYDEFFVPRLFEPWAKLLLEAADLRRGESVLDIATGPGTVARLAAVRVGAEGRVVAIDIAQPMLDIAKAKAPPPGAAPIEYLKSPSAPLGQLKGATISSASAAGAPSRNAAWKAAKIWLRSSSVHTAMAARPPGFNTRRISRKAAGRSGKNCSPC